MDIRFLGKNITVTEGMRDHLRDKLAKLEKYSPKLIESHVVLKKEKYFYDAQVTLLAKHFQAYGEGKRKENVYAAIDEACGRVEKQLKKFHEKIKDHHKEHGEKALPLKIKTAQKILKETEMPASRPKIIRSKSFAPKPMSVDEASLQLEISGEPFLVFLNATSRKVNVLFRREDGNHGLVEPEF
ncbi:MAG: ribosome-associated translation inhibitor RaiA [Candidatus Omnitrophica bacterium]|nr:ribosome-associated translation inhibitor RaiA [Candidatus Omnitrophota bacterium]